MYWYQTLGYEKNPLEVNPLLIDFELTKYYEELDKLTYLLAAGNIVLLKGPDGSGKTALQNELQKRLNKTNKTFYLNARKMSMNKNVEGLLMDQRGFLRKIIGLELNEVILLLDNAEYLTEENTERIKYHYDHNHLKSVLFSTAKEEMLNFTQSMRRRIGTREITLRKLSAKDAIVITNKRLGEQNPLKDRVMVKIFQLSGENIKEYLINCAALLRYLVENDKKKITEKELEELLLNNFYQEKKSSDTCHLCSDKLVYINKKWRCPKCETYCLKCGLIITKEDEKCPKCGAKTK